MSSPVVKLALVTASLAVASLAVAAPRDGISGAPSPIPLHELNYSPSFADYPRDLTLLPGTRGPSITSEEQDPLRKRLSLLQARLEALREERDVLLLKKLAFTAGDAAGSGEFPRQGNSVTLTVSGGNVTFRPASGALKDSENFVRRLQALPTPGNPASLRFDSKMPPTIVRPLQKTPAPAPGEIKSL